MYSSITNHIRVTVEPEYIPAQSRPKKSVFAFAYTVTIENLGSEAVQLLERHWIIHSGLQQFAEVVGPGVVGEQPILDAGHSFQYTSSAVIEDPTGSMRGTYTFRSEDGKFFDAEIPQFDLYYPEVIH